MLDEHSYTHNLSNMEVETSGSLASYTSLLNKSHDSERLYLKSKTNKQTNRRCGWLRWGAQLFKCVNPSTYSIYELLNHEEESVLQNLILEHSITHEDENLKHGYDRSHLGDVLVFIVLQRAEALRQTNDLWQ